MPAKSHRSGLGKHSRSSSASKIATAHSSSRPAQPAGLQFTPANTSARTKEEKLRKLEGHPRPASPFGRPNSRNSFQRTKSRDHIQPHAAPPISKLHAGKQKGAKAFTLASSSSDEEDQWVSESPTPDNQMDSDLEQDPSPEKLMKAVSEHADLQRVETARVNGFKADETPIVRANKALPSLDLPQRAPSLPKIQTSQPTPPPNLSSSQAKHQSQTQPPTPISAKRDTSRRHSHRPPSVHSLASVPARPHPLIRGASFAEPSKAQTSSEATTNETTEPVIGRSSSPTASLRSLSKYSPTGQTARRRTSVSSVNTLPASPNPAASALHATQQKDARDRQRTLSTLSTLSTSSSHAGISSLFHIPAFSRPPSPPLQSTRTLIAKHTVFPPSPFIHTREYGADVLAQPDGTSIHPLLPTPYMQTHLSVLGTRSMLRESYDRVRLAKGQGRR